MKAVILAGGQGTRLKSVIHDIPKPMAPVQGRPFLEFLVSRLIGEGVCTIILSVGYLHKQIMDHFGDGSNLHATIEYCIEHEPLGTGGGVREALRMADSDDVLVMNGDTFAAVDVKNVVKHHKQLGAVMTMVAIPVVDASRYGTVNISSEGLVTAFAEKKRSDVALINSGVYIVNKKLLDIIPAGTVSLELDVLPELAEKGLLAAQIQDVPFIDIGVPSDYHEFCQNSSKYTGF
ncbi:MAG: nucleotidyltransferase family protein [Desulfuromonadaceae bacterium]|nr:nucleotidyltransferase family protein [Desulfuromonadaceae bacterium]